MARNGTNGDATAASALRRMAKTDPELAARLVVMSLPAAAAPLPADLAWRLDVKGLGSWLVHGGSGNGGATVESADDDGSMDAAAFTLSTDAEGLARLAAGASPVALMLNRQLRVRGQRRKALAMRKLDGEAGPRELAKLGAPVDPDLVFRSLPFAIEQEWTRGHRFGVAYELSGEGGGRWLVEVDDGPVRVSNGSDANVTSTPNATIRTSLDTWLSLLRGDITPSAAMQQQLTTCEGELYPVTLLGRWIDRAAGVDGPELERETRQSELQQRRIGSWGAGSNGRNGSAGSKIDPAERKATGARDNLMTYQELYALWEQRNWRAHELDFSIDRDHWLATPSEGQKHTAHTMGSFFVGEERVAADLAPFMLAAPNAEVETFLATQLVDEARHAVFFDRWGAEVMALTADDMRGRLNEMEAGLLGPWHFLFDESLRGVANRLLKTPDDLELFVEGIVTYHMVTEGVLAMTGQRSILRYTSEHDIFPGFQKGFSLVEQDEHRHIAFGVRFLRDVCDERPEMRNVVLATLEKLLPEAAKVFAPPEVDDPSDFTSYAFHSSQIYGHAYEALRRRMNVIGVEIPGPERLMPGPIDPAGFDGEGVHAAASAA